MTACHIETGRKAKLDTIRKFVLKERMRHGITELKGPMPELSCIAVGEFHNLLWRSLMYTPESYWHELSDPEILDGVYKEALKIEASKNQTPRN